MRWEDWEPLYSEILVDMGYRREDDESAAALLASMLDADSDDSDSRLRSALAGREVTVVGAAPGVESALEGFEAEGVVIAAGSACLYLMDAGIVPDMLVTDLDGDAESQLEACRQGAIPLLHAHGDNMGLLREMVPLMTGAMGSCQCEPLPGLVNYGGFTDGDRAVCLARHFGAGLNLLGFDFNDARGEGEEREIKMRKLRWAEKIVRICAPESFQDAEGSKRTVIKAERDYC